MSGEETCFTISEAEMPGERPAVCVIITAFNHAHFLAEALASALAQTLRPEEIIVVDDGSDDDPAAVIADFPSVRMIRQENRGLAAARNTGLRNCRTSHIVFLDADDRLLPNALQSGVVRAMERPECAFVYGAFRLISEDGKRLGGDCYRPMLGDAHLACLRGNPIGMHATVLYRRDYLMEMGGFDEALRRCEDYDLALRITRKYPICDYPTVVAEYRRHRRNMSADAVGMLRTILAVLNRHEARIVTNKVEQEALRYGRAYWRNYYVSEMLRSLRIRWSMRKEIGGLVRGLMEAAIWSPRTVVHTLFSWTSAFLLMLPHRLVRRI